MLELRPTGEGEEIGRYARRVIVSDWTVEVVMRCNRNAMLFL